MARSLLAAVLLGVPAIVSAQDAATGGGAQTARALLLADLPTLGKKFTALADAFPLETYDWRPGPGVRSVRDVLTLMVVENGLLVPESLGLAKMPGIGSDPAEAAAVIAALPDKAAVVVLVERSFVYASSYWKGASPSVLRASHPFFGRSLSTEQMILAVLTDQHEHLGQLIAYARTNGVVPPWSRAAPR